MHTLTISGILLTPTPIKYQPAFTLTKVTIQNFVFSYDVPINQQCPVCSQSHLFT
jgi:hypothetical protein